MVLTSLLLLSLTAFSQIDTSKTEKCFSIPTVRLIMKDLLSGDSAKAHLNLSELEIKELERKIVLKDSVITTLRLKENNYLSVITSEKEKFGILENYTKKIEFDLKKERVKNKFKSIVGGGLIVVLTFLLIKN